MKKHSARNVFTLAGETLRAVGRRALAGASLGAILARGPLSGAELNIPPVDTFAQVFAAMRYQHHGNGNIRTL